MAAAEPDAPVADVVAWRDITVSARDGLLLHARDYGPTGSDRLPVVCLPGLTRTCRDFHELAVHLSSATGRPRRVVTMDFRGRGASGWDRDWRRYAPLVEMEDVLDLLVAARIDRACFVGTSRGGIVAMLLGAARPTAIAAVVLNDVGPEIDGRGLLRIKNMLAATGAPRSWEDAVVGLRAAHAAHFPGIDAEGWEAFARKTYDDRNGRPVRAFDPKLTRTLEAIDYSQPLPTMWPQFDSLAHVPVMVVRGANSDILSRETVTRMQERRADLDVLEVADAGHAPMLVEPHILSRIAAFVAAADGRKT
ncbi:pimeloyl-ACP methyl ester carboxylesterase [Tepidamorphus gemmatus]|uniref:Pimeloyl-ACP methyl ester carboxylesterase n=1 Tax=Tepidamorphus gemmatus TaxID=747076 RepID=A0A4R3MD92_9HYPH|nr:alpha/beta hydrolase [Tepidamorphus gemmatus]TCT11521.1 pimeloyl-ACP methyl ester carboxylesterase [Tepidamorphus gemmatus]